MKLLRWIVTATALMLIVTQVSPASAAPEPGDRCQKAGREHVSATRTLRCTSVSGRTLRWRVVSTPTAATTTTTASTSTVTDTRAPLVSEISADDVQMHFMLSGMSPDTGNYAVQWVERGQSFNSYETVQATSAEVSIPAQTFSCNRTYTFRVFVMRAGWELAQGHTNQNVTPHSNPFDVTMTHPCNGNGATTTTVAATCATGGVCVVGDTGPGGGIVFYVAAANFTSTGSDCNTSCRHLELAPAPGGGDVNRNWATNVNSNQSTLVSGGATGTGIGSGMSNTNAIQAQTGNDSATSAAVYAYEYSNGGKSDWHLPSLNELNELCKYARNTGQAAGGATVCAGGSAATARGFVEDLYWSSSEQGGGGAKAQHFADGMQGGWTKVSGGRVRPVRAF